jgi:hypothetical protein
VTNDSVFVMAAVPIHHVNTTFIINKPGLFINIFKSVKFWMRLWHSCFFIICLICSKELLSIFIHSFENILNLHVGYLVE